MHRESRSRSPPPMRERSNRQPEERRRHRDERDYGDEEREYRDRKRYKDSRYDGDSRRSYSGKERERERSSEGRRDLYHDRNDRERSLERDRRRRNDDYSDRGKDRESRDRDRYRDRESREDKQEGPSNSLVKRPQPGSLSPSRSSSAIDDKEKDKGKPNFKNSGLLAAATNTVKLADGSSTVLKYNEPPEARKPLVGWRLYVFKGEEQSDPLHIHKQSCYLIGRDRAITDIPVEHPSCSKQHAAIQYRQIKIKDEYGAIKTSIKPFIIDLESTNGTLVNDEKIPAARYYELQAGDVIKFGQSTREYVLMSDNN